MKSNASGRGRIDLPTAIPGRTDASDSGKDTPPARFGDPRGVITAILTGQLRQRFYSDVNAFGGDDDASTQQVASGYACLYFGVGWLLSALPVLVLSPLNVVAHVLAVLNACICFYGFLRIGRRGDASAVLGWVLILAMTTVCLLSLRSAGDIPPSMSVMPAICATIILFLRGPIQKAAIVLAVGIFVFAALTRAGLVGAPSSRSADNRTLMTLMTLALTAGGLVAIARLANLTRDYVIDKLRAANVSMSEHTARNSVALEAAKVGLWDVPDVGKPHFSVSESFQSITGYTAAEFDAVFGALHDFVHADDLAGLRQAFVVSRERMTRLHVDFRLKTRTRGYRWFSARAVYLRNPDGTMRISGSLQDINFIKAAEEALRAGRDRAREADKAKSDFIAVMSHEVRTPLNAILGSVEVLKRSDRTPETREMVALIDDAGRSLLSLVNDLLDVSKIEAGKVQVTLAPTDLVDLVSRTADFWRPQASAKGLRLSVDVGEAAGADPVLADAGRVRQIISNLISNAIKFTDAGAVTVAIRMGGQINGYTDTVIEVCDTGPGVPDRVRDQIFAPFEQGEQAGHRGGTGLGLFISRRLARLMGGDLTLEAQPQGACFRLAFRPQVNARSLAQSNGDASDPAWAGLKVLCVDDNETNRRIIQLLLSKFGVDVAACASGAQANEAGCVETYDAVLMDIGMPGMDGPATLARIRAAPQSRNTNTPVIALTAKLATDDLARYAETGFDGVVGKPISVHELAHVLAPFMVRQNT